MCRRRSYQGNKKSKEKKELNKAHDQAAELIISKLDEGKNVILKIEVQGASNIKKMYPDSVGVFLLPPSMEVLENRLRSRGTEDEDDVKKRLEIASEKKDSIFVSIHMNKFTDSKYISFITCLNKSLTSLAIFLIL